MTRWAPRKTDILDALAAEILHNYGKGRVIVAVDGLEGTSAFSADLAEALKRAGHTVLRASLNAFRQQRLPLYAAGADPDNDRFDTETLNRVLIDPFRDAAVGSVVLAAYDPERGVPVEPKWVTARPDTILLMDGTFLQSSELRGLWHYSIWLQGEAQPTPDQAKYLKQSKPSAAANAIIDNSDPSVPRRVFADSC